MRRGLIIGTMTAVGAAWWALAAAPALADPAPLLQFGSSGSGAGQLNTPFDAAVDAAGHVFVGEGNNHRVSEFDAAGNFIQAFGIGVRTGSTAFEVCTAASGCQTPTAGAGNPGDVGAAGHLLIDSSGRLYVSDTNGNRVNVFDISSGTPTFVEAFGWDVVPGGGTGFEVCTAVCQGDFTGGSEFGRFHYPKGMALDGTGRLFIADDRNNRIAMVNVAGAVPTYLGAFGWGVVPGSPGSFGVCTSGSGCQAGQPPFSGNPGQVRDPFSVALDAAGRLYVADTFEDRIVVYDVSGAPTPGAAFGWGVVDGSDAFQVCTTSCQIGKIGGGAGEFFGPSDLGLDATGRLSVVDQSNSRVSVFDVNSTPAFVHSYGWDVIPGGPTGYEVCTGATGCKAGTSGSGAGQFFGVSGLAVDCRGAVWVPDNAGRVQRFGEPGTPSPPCETPGGGAVGSSSDKTPPQTTIGKGPKKRTHKRKAKFQFVSNEPGSTFKCKLDRKPFRPCTAPKTIRVKPGKHSFQVAAIDPAGNVDPTPASFRWKVLR